jgi:hypothetical protein
LVAADCCLDGAIELVNGRDDTRNVEFGVGEGEHPSFGVIVAEPPEARPRDDAFRHHVHVRKRRRRGDELVQPFVEVLVCVAYVARPKE